jgi:3-oxoacyl-[acyl-carrier protein] reductase
MRSNAAAAAAKAGRDLDAFLVERARDTPPGRVGDPAEFGDACAFLCGANAGFIVGQNLLLDGGAFNATMG